MDTGFNQPDSYDIDYFEDKGRGHMVLGVGAHPFLASAFDDPLYSVIDVFG